MINRDFTKPGKQYIKQNKFVLIALAAVILAGVIMLCVFGGFKGGSDVSGYNTFSVKIGSEYKADKLANYTENINMNLAENKAELLSVQLTGEGDSTTLIVKYSGKAKDIEKLNQELAADLQLDVTKISQHSSVSASLDNKDYIYAVVAGLVILALAVIYIGIRYNLACAITAMAGSLLSVVLLMALTAIFRFTINSSFLAINIITLVLALVESVMLFDSLEKERAKLIDKNDRSAQVANTLKANSFRQKFTYGALFALALIFIILMPTVIKQASLIMLFAIVVLLFVAVYALPFLWCLTITQVSDKIRMKKEKNIKAKQSVEEVEGELEQNYTENQVIEVKEDDGSTPSNDDNITIE